MWCLCATADEIIPPAPLHHFNDYAQLVSTGIVARLDKILETYEQESSDQIVVAVYPKMQSDAPILDYTLRIANSWKVGKKGKNNGVAVFVFAQDHQLYIQVGTGLEKALPDAKCKEIIETQIVPNFKKGDFDAGLSAGVTAIISAIEGANQGKVRTTTQPRDTSTNNPGLSGY